MAGRGVADAATPRGLCLAPRGRQSPSLKAIQEGGSMMKRILGVAIALAMPTLLAAQTPIPANDHSSAAAKGKLIPSANASDTAKARVAANMARRATHVRGEAVGPDNQPVTPATRAIPAQ